MKNSKKVERMDEKMRRMKEKEVVGDEEVANWAKHQYFECLKTEFILKRIINPIEK